MVGIGENSGSLREMLDEVASFYDAEAEVKLEQLTTLLEPAILLVHGRDRRHDLAGDISADHPDDLGRTIDETLMADRRHQRTMNEQTEVTTEYIAKTIELAKFSTTSRPR